MAHIVSDAEVVATDIYLLKAPNECHSKRLLPLRVRSPGFPVCLSSLEAMANLVVNAEIHLRGSMLECACKICGTLRNSVRNPRLALVSGDPLDDLRECFVDLLLMNEIKLKSVLVGSPLEHYPRTARS